MKVWGINLIIVDIPKLVGTKTNVTVVVDVKTSLYVDEITRDIALDNFVLEDGQRTVPFDTLIHS